MGNKCDKQKQSKLKLHLQIKSLYLNLRGNFEKSVDLSKFIARHYIIEENGIIFFKNRNEDIYYTKKLAHAKLSILQKYPKFRVILNSNEAFLVNLSDKNNHQKFWLLVHNEDHHFQHEHILQEKKIFRVGMIYIKVIKINQPHKGNRQRGDSKFKQIKIDQKFEEDQDNFQTNDQEQKECIICKKTNNQSIYQCCDQFQAHTRCLIKNYLNELGSKQKQNQQSTIIIETEDLCCDFCQLKFPKDIIDQILDSLGKIYEDIKFLIICQFNKKEILKYFLLKFTKKKEFSIGRNFFNDIVFENKTVSNNHAQIILKDQKFYIEDLNSRCGTHIQIKDQNRIPIHHESCLSIDNFFLEIHLYRNQRQFCCKNKIPNLDQKQHINKLIKDSFGSNVNHDTLKITSQLLNEDEAYQHHNLILQKKGTKTKSEKEKKRLSLDSNRLDKATSLKPKDEIKL